jgi:glycosyltransferase involved in cell wall biosynthesis
VKVILVITELELGGAQKHVLEIAQRLPHDRYEVALVTNSRGMLIETARAMQGVALHIVPALVRPIRPLHDLAALVWMWRLFRRERPALVHTHSSKAGLLGRWAARLAGVPRIVHTVHGWGFDAVSSPLLRRWMVTAERRTARFTHRLVAVSEATRKAGIGFGIRPAGDYEVIHHAIDLKAVADATGARAETRAALGISPDAPAILTVACFKPQKAPLDFVEVCKTLSEQIPDVRCLMIGDGLLRSDIESKVAEYGLESNVHLLGWRCDVLRLLQAADVFVLTSRWEGMPGALLEAMASGIPAVVNDVGGVREVVKDGVNGFVTAPGDTRQMVQRIRQLLEAPPFRIELGQRARAAVDARFSIDAMVARLDALYQGIRVTVHDGRTRAKSVMRGNPIPIPALIGEGLRIPFVMQRAKRDVTKLAGTHCDVDWSRLRDDRKKAALYVWTETWPGAGEPGGVMTHTLGVLSGLSELGFAVTALCPGTASLGQHVARVVPVEPRRQMSHLPEVMEADYNRRILEAPLSGMDPMLVYHRSSRNHYAAALIAKQMRAPFVLEYNASISWEARHWGRKLWFPRFTERVERAVLRSAQLVTVVSDRLRDDVVAQGVDPDNVLVNPNGVDVQRFHPGVNGDDVRRQYGLDDKTVVGHVGTFRRRHGVSTLVDAAALAVAAGHDIHLLLVGDGPDSPRLRKRVRELGLDDCVTFTGLLPHRDVPAQLAACDILVSPQDENPDGSEFHGSPTKLFEYMAMAKPVVASDMGQVAKVLDNGESGMLVKPGDAAELCRALVALAKDQDLRKKLGARAVAVVAQRHTWDRHVERLISKLRSLAGRHHGN